MGNIKKYINIAFLVGLFLSSSVFAATAAEITAIDFYGKVIGQVISTGMVINAAGENIGNITADSLIVNDKGEILGGVVPQGIAIGFDNRLLGKVHNDGLVRSLSGKPLGRVLPNGLVISENSQIVGTVMFPGLIYAADGTTIGRLTGGGDYIDLDGQKIGFVSANGYAYRKSGNDYFLDGRLLAAKMVISNQGKFLGSVAPTGRVIDFEAKDIGLIHANGFAFNSSGEVIGSVVSSGYAFNLHGQYMGIVGYNGEVKNADSTIGYYRADGNIIDLKGDVVGFAVNLAATANDNSGKYLGYLIPGGYIVNGQQVVGRIGAKGYVYNAENNKIGELIKSGPIYDADAELKAQAMKNGQVINLGGSHIGFMRGRYAFDNNGVLIGGITGDMFAVDDKGSLGVANIDSSVSRGTAVVKVSPFGYLIDGDGKVEGRANELAPLYDAHGMLYSYVTPAGELYNNAADGVRITSSGIALGPNGYIGELLPSRYALSFNSQNLGMPTQTNLLLDTKGMPAYKIVPGNYVVESSDPSSLSLIPIKGFSGKHIMALHTNGDIIGYADNIGRVFDLRGAQYGRLASNEYVIDNNGVVGGKLIPFSVVVNDKCATLGVVNGRGDVVNNRGVVVGHLLTNGQAVSDIGSYIGYSVPQEGIMDFDGNYVGTVNISQGIDKNGKILGCVNRKGMIADADNRIVYGLITPHSVIDFENRIIGYVIGDGSVIDSDNQPIGYMQPDGNVVTGTKKTLGNVMRYKVAYDNSNNFIGLVQNSGQVTDAKGGIIGQVNFDGSVYRDGDIIGYALYDLYVYDDNFTTFGYLTGDGTVLGFNGSRLGRMDRGFVLDKQNNVVARGNRDYIVRDVSNNAVGELHLDGKVTDLSGKTIGSLSDAGVIRDSDGNEIAIATPLQYYVYIEGESPQNESPSWADYKRGVRIVDAEKPGETDTFEPYARVPGARQPNIGKRPQASGEQKYGKKVVGIALNLDGDYIGDIYEDHSVKDKDGKQIGYRTTGGIIVDMDHEPIGVEEVKKKSVDEIFMPANAFGPGSPYGIGSQPSNLGPGGGYGQGERYDPVRARALAQLQAARRHDISVGKVSSSIKASSFTGYEENGWPGQQQNISTWRVDMSEMILEDKAIPAVLARSVYASEGFSSNIPITAIVERNVYAEEGRNIIIPAGSRVIGSLGGEGGEQGGNSGGAVKIGITWRRLIRPDGSQFTFSNAQTADSQGRSGAIGYLDEQLLKRYSLPIVTSMLQSGMAYVMARGSGSTTTDTSSTQDARSSAADDARENFLQQMDQIFTDIMERKSQIRSVVYVPAGTRIIIYPNQDLWLNSLSRDKNRQEIEEANNEKGLTTSHPDQEGGDEVTYNGNYRENVRPVSAGSQSAPANTGRNPAGYVPPAKDQSSDVPVTTGTSSDGIPELL